MKSLGFGGVYIYIYRGGGSGGHRNQRQDSRV